MDRRPLGHVREARGHRHLGLPEPAEHERHWLAAASIIATVVSTAVSAYAQYQQGQTQQAASNYQAAVARNNQIIADRNAAAARAQAAAEAEQVQRRDALFMGHVRAAYGGSGVTEEGSPLLVMADTAKQAELDVANTKYRGELAARGFQAQAMSFGAQSTLDKYLGGVYGRSGIYGAGATLLSGAARAGQQYYAARAPSTTTTAIGNPYA